MQVPGIDVNAGSRWGARPLHIAARRNRMALARILLEHGADVNKRTRGGFSAFNDALKLGHYEMASMFIREWGADVTAPPPQSRVKRDTNTGQMVCVYPNELLDDVLLSRLAAGDWPGKDSGDPLAESVATSLTTV